MKFEVVCKLIDLGVDEYYVSENEEDYENYKDKIRDLLILDYIPGQDWFEDCQITQKSFGHFPDPHNLVEEYYVQIKNVFNSFSEGKIFGKIKNDSGEVLKLEYLNIIDDYIDSCLSSEQSIIDACELTLITLKNFLKKGSWQYALKREDGVLIKSISKWPTPKTIDKTIIFEDKNHKYYPMIWFGLINEKPIDCWSIESNGNYKNNNLCFNSYWELDWNILFDTDAEQYITWMFYECGMDEPTSEMDYLKKSCPIIIEETDHLVDMQRKVNKFFELLIQN